MKSLPKLIRRFIGILLLSTFLLLILNIIVLIVIGSNQIQNGAPWETAEEAAAALQYSNGEYLMSDEMADELQQSDIWAMYLDNTTLQVVWDSGDLPAGIDQQYTASSIANLTRGYIMDYPTFTGESEHGLMVLGYPKKSFWKHLWPSWDYNLIANVPKIILTILAANLLMVFLIYLIANTKLLQSVKPIVSGIEGLSTGESVQLSEKGVLSELSNSINQTSRVLQAQKHQLRKKETARANWIAGVSHDIRTPLSMVMGYAGQLEQNEHLTDVEKDKVAVILRQTERMKNLINDLNLASKMEYNMQPLHMQKENVIAIVRQVIVDFINNDIEAKYPIELETPNNLTTCYINADNELLKRAITNLIQNSINHNESGCNIYVTILGTDTKCRIVVEDDGVGATDSELVKLNNTPHYMLCDSNTTEQRHGLGLLIVKQIVEEHHGSTVMEHSETGGFKVELVLPVLSSNK